MEFIADLHLHSHFSRATAKNLDLEHLYQAARLKGVTLVGTGDFTHPGWMAELEAKLIPAEPGLYKLKTGIEEKLDQEIPQACRGQVRFILQSEISSIYKKEGRVRKNHNLLYFPDLETVKRFNGTLDRIGNIKSDGRPILGLDAEKLLSIMLDTCGDAFLIPAHIWTPWFSMFGSKSGFDSIEECFGDLSGEIFAAETGLSSDPPMNWRVKALDHITLVSNSDAHSPMYLGRNASMFGGKLPFDGVKKALSGGDDNYLGTIDMFPEEGKYHYDGHRKCNVCLNPGETVEREGLCPECGKPLTLGVLYRVQELASRPEGYDPGNRHPFRSIIPLADILSEIFDVGPKTKKVGLHYDMAMKRLGAELGILLKTPVSDIEAAGIPLLAEAVRRMRRGEVSISPGFDGEYGKVKIFEPEEKRRLRGENDMFSQPGPQPVKKKSGPKSLAPKKSVPAVPVPEKRVRAQKKESGDILATLNPEQQQAINCQGRPILIEAGPGTGKTRTLTARIAWLIRDQKVAPGSILALTFTNRAAKEMAGRIDGLIPGRTASVCAATFHSFCLMVLKEYTGFSSAIVDDTDRQEIFKEAFAGAGASAPSMDALDRMISTAKQHCLRPGDDLAPIAGGDYAPVVSRVWTDYQALLAARNLVDFEDLISMVVNLLRTDTDLLATLQHRFCHIFVDEYQDINRGQYLLTKFVAGTGEGLVVIGDPDQSIYGFRGSDNTCFKRFFTDYANAEKIVLQRNYRSTQAILSASHQLISHGQGHTGEQKIFSDIHGKERLIMLEAASDKAEAVAVGKRIESLMGGTSLFSMDAGKADPTEAKEFSFADFAVLYRTRRQSRIFAEVFERAGIPFQTADKESILVHPGIGEIISLVKIIRGGGTLQDLFTVFDHMKTGMGKKTREQLGQWFHGLDLPLDRAVARLAAAPLPGVRKNIGEKLSVSAGAVTSLRKNIQGLGACETLQTLARGADILPLIEENPESREVFERLSSDAANCSDDLGKFLESVALNGDTESLWPDAEKVSLMTMHAAKGLEFPVVFVTGCEKGLLPFARPGKSPLDIDEERRLFYVAMTRAQEILCLTYAKKRRIYSTMKETGRSVFLSDIEEALKEYNTNKYRGKKKQPCVKQLDLFD
ncbi:MAG: UvrD-helicase domain-containing protein [Desulfobacteraceae bacterium]|nr:UvrD-helicase domain-containing protein [Desulfobacteraceae bacterium]